MKALLNRCGSITIELETDAERSFIFSRYSTSPSNLFVLQLDFDAPENITDDRTAIVGMTFSLLTKEQVEDGNYPPLGFAPPVILAE